MLKIVVHTRENKYEVVREVPKATLAAFPSCQPLFFDLARSLRDKGFAVAIMDTDVCEFLPF